MPVIFITRTISIQMKILLNSEIALFPKAILSASASLFQKYSYQFLCFHLLNCLIRCPFGYLFARTSGNYRRAAYAVTTPYQTSGITIPSACISKVNGSPSTELHYMVYYPLTAFDFDVTTTVTLNKSPWTLVPFYPFTRLVPCTSFFIFRSLELLI